LAFGRLQNNRARLAIVVCLTTVGCASDFHFLTVSKNSIYGSGRVSTRLGEQLTEIEIDLRSPGTTLAADIWIEMPDGENTTLDSISRVGLIRENARERKEKHNEYYRYSDKTRFELPGFVFWFDDDRLVGVEARPVVQGASQRSVRPALGSRSRETSLTLPCTSQEFESVFGKADRVKMGHGW